MTKDITANQYKKVVQHNRELQQKIMKLNKQLEPFEDEYFKGLSYKEIAALAKTRLAAGEELNNVIHLLEYIKDELVDLDVSNSHISNILKSIEGVVKDED